MPAVEVVEVVPDSPADQAGLRAEDLIVSLAGEPVTDVVDVQRLMAADLIGTPDRGSRPAGPGALVVEIVPVELADRLEVSCDPEGP